MIGVSLFLSILLTLSGSESVFTLGTPGMLANGMEIVLVHIPGMPVIATSIHVHVGTEFEDTHTNGATHLLEHLLFNGTSTMTQEELYERMDLDGLYINAATRSSGTIIIGLSPKNQVHSLLETASDMLFDSSIPDEKFDKERRIVLEEIAQYDSYPGAAVRRWISSRLFHGSPFALPTLGTEHSLEGLTRNEVYTYYKEHYVPNNSTLYLIGDYQWPDIWDVLKETFGRFDEGSLPDKSVIRIPDIASLSADTGYMPLILPKLILAFDSPDPGDPDFPAVHLGCSGIEDFLSLHADSLISDASIEHILHSDFSRILLTIDLSDSAAASLVSADLEARLESAILYITSPHRLDGLKREWSGYFLRTLERPHMFTLFFEDLLSVMGWDGMEQLASSVSVLDSVHVSRSLRKWFIEYDYRPFLILPGPPSRQSSTLMDGMPSVSRISRSQARPEIPREKIPEISDEMMPQTASHMVIDTTESGMIICVRQSPGLPVSGLHILFRQRNMLESPERYGSAELLHRIFGFGSVDLYGDAFEDTLNTLGVDLQVTDNPMIPFDDYYYSPRWGYIRLTSPQDSFLKAVELLRNVLVTPRFEETTVEREKATIRRLIQRKNRMPRSRAGSILKQQFLSETPHARSPLGTLDSIDSIRVEDVRSFHERYIQHGNIILSVCTPNDAETLADSIRTLFSIIPSDSISPVSPIRPPRVGPWVFEDSLGTGQSYVMTFMSFHVERRERAAVKVLAEILDRRMSWLIREERGLSYSLGASAGFLGNHGWLIASVGTRPESILETQSCLKRLFAELLMNPVESRKELRIAARTLERRELLRRLTRTGEAMAMGIKLLNGNLPRRVEEEMIDYFHVSTSDLLKIASRLDRDKQGWVIVH